MDFRKELESLLNAHSKENGSKTPDFILAEYITDCLDSFDKATRNRDEWMPRSRAKPILTKATRPREKK